MTIESTAIIGWSIDTAYEPNLNKWLLLIIGFFFGALLAIVYVYIFGSAEKTDELRLLDIEFFIGNGTLIIPPIALCLLFS